MAQPDPSVSYRPLIAEKGKHVLAGGWCQFDNVEVTHAGENHIVAGSEIPADVLETLTARRAPIVGLDLSSPKIMGILNVTPDSFSDGGQFQHTKAAVDHAMKLQSDGADILDIGGESTRPGAEEVSISEEIERTFPVIEAIRKVSDVPISIDTRKWQVAELAIQAGADLVNDVSGFEFDPEMAPNTAKADVGVCLMHSKGLPKNMQNDPSYNDVVTEVVQKLSAQVEFAIRHDLDKSKILVDPGIGFGKTLQHNLDLLKNQTCLHSLGCGILIGASRKKFIGTLTNTETANERVSGSVSVALNAVAQGAQVVRVHDVLETKQALTMWQHARGLT